MSEKIAEIVEKIKGLSLLEASELKKALEDEFGVTASAPVMMAGAAPAAANGHAGSHAETAAINSLGETLSRALCASRTSIIAASLMPPVQRSMQPRHRTFAFLASAIRERILLRESHRCSNSMVSSRRHPADRHANGGTKAQGSK